MAEGKTIWTFLLYLVTAFLDFSCATTPTGRRQLHLVSEGEMQKMGVQAFSELKAKTPVERSPSINRYVKCVSTQLTKTLGSASPLKDWEVVVFRDASANAFALPGGKIGVHTGLLKVAKTPDQLAAVIGHEIGHVTAHHGNERMSQALLTQAGMVLADELLRENSSRGLVLGALGLGAQFGVLLPFSRKHETEADQIGQDLMARAGFRPQESIELWKNMAAAGGSQPPEFLSTHPSHSSRIAELSSHLGRTTPFYKEAVAAGKTVDCGPVPPVVASRSR